MSNEIIFEIKVEQSTAIASFGKVQDALFGFQEAVTLTATTMDQLSSVEKSVTSQTEALEKAWGLSYETMFDLQEETANMIDVINKNGDAFAHSEAKMSLMKKSLQEQVDKYKTYGHEVPKSLEEVAVKYGVMASEAEKAAEKEKKMMEDAKKAVGKLHEDISSFVEGFKSLGTMVGFDAGIFDGIQKGLDSTKELATQSIDKVLSLNEQFKAMGKVAGPVFKSLKSSFSGVFDSMKNSGAGFFKSFKGGMAGVGTAMKSSIKGGLASIKGAWKGMSTSMKFSVGLVGVELVGKGLAAIADAYSDSCQREMASIYERAAVEKKAFDDLAIIRKKGSDDLKKKMKEMVEAAIKRGDDLGKTALKIQKAYEKEIEAIKKQEAAEKKHRKEVAETTKALGIMTDGAMKKLNHESQLMAEAIEKGTVKWGEHRTMTDAVKKMLQEQMDKYVDMKKQVPQNLQAIADKHGVLTSKQQEWKEKTDAMKESLGLLTREGARNLRQETDLLIKTVERNKEAFINNSTAAATMRDRIQEQLDKYEGFNNVPPKLKSLADSYGVVSSKQEAVMKSVGLLTEGGMKNLNNETALLVKTIDDNSDAFTNNTAKARLAKEEIEKQIEKYKSLGEKAPEELLRLETKFKDVKMSTEEARKRQDEYNASLGFVNAEDVKDQLDKMTTALQEQAQQYKNNPKMLEDLIVKMNELEAQAKQSGVELPKAYEKEKTALEKYKKAIDDTAKHNKKLVDEKEKLKNSIEKLTPMQVLLGKAFGMSDKQMVKFYESSGKIGKSLTDIASHGKEVLGFLKDTEIVSGKTAEALDGLVGGIGDIGAGFSQLAANPVGGAMKILGGTVKAVTSIFKLFAGDGVGEAIDREREMIDISEEMEQKIRDLEETLDDTHAATSMLMNEIIAEAEINKENFGDYAQRTRDILADLDRGTLSIQQTRDAMGSAFNELLGEAQRLGTEGSKEMINLLKDVRSRGLEVAEMQDYVNQKLDQGVDALKNYLGTFADSGAIQEEIAALNAQLAEGSLSAEEVATKQEELAQKQQELSAATADVTANWDFMQTAAMSTFNALESQGYSFMDIVGMMQEQFSSIGQMAMANGLEVSEGLQAMTDLSTFISQNEDLTTRIDSTRVMMESLGDSAFLTGNDFLMFAQQTGQQFDDILAKTNDQEMALRLISPSLENLIKYSESYGYQIDENTQKLIDQAREEGVLAKETHSDQQVTNRLLLSIAEAWGAHIPEGLRKFGEEFDASMQAVQGKTAETKENLSDFAIQTSWSVPEFPVDKIPRSVQVPVSWETSGKGNIPKYAEGTGGWVEVKRPTLFIAGEGGEPEFMNVIPRSKLSVPSKAPLSSNYPEPLQPRPVQPYRDSQPEENHGGDTYNEYFIFENVSLYTENGEDAVRDFMTAFKENKMGVKSMIRRAIRQMPARGE